MKKALKHLDEMKNNLESEIDSHLKDKLEFLNGLDIAVAMTKAALAREESRGAHFRLDFPESDFSFARHTITKF